MKTKRILCMLSFVTLLCSAFSGIAMAQKSIVNDYPELKPVVEFVGENNLSVLHLLGVKASIVAMKELPFSKGDPNILTFTDAGYIAKISAYTTEKALDGVMMTTGASRGKGNLVNVHKPYNAPLWFAFFYKLPSAAPKREYTIISIPPRCKDDALIQIFETNVGHRRMFVKGLTKAQRKRLPGNAKNVADIVIRWRRRDQKGSGLVLGFNWDKVFKGTRIERKAFMDFKGHGWWWTRLKMDMWMMDYLDKPEALVYTIKEFDVKSPAEIEKLEAAGVNPLVELGIMPKP